MRLLEAQAALASYRDTHAQPDLFSAIESVADHAGEPWKEQAIAVLEHVARERPELTVEDVAPLVEVTVDMRALGAIKLTGKRRGWLEPLGYVNANAERHRKPIRLWRSRLYRGGLTT
jgi:hypothetical protein